MAARHLRKCDTSSNRRGLLAAGTAGFGGPALIAPRHPDFRQIDVASPVRDNITSPETEQTFRRCSHSRSFMEPMQEAKQMTTAQAVGGASHTSDEFSIAVRIGCKPVSSRYYLHLSQTASSFVKGALWSARAV